LNAALRILRFWPGALLLLWIAAGLRSIALGKDVNWDLKNYHWYNAWAVLNGRVGYDVAPAQLQTYHNPLGDLPFYGLVHAIQNPRTVAFIMALPVAVAAYFLLRTLCSSFPSTATARTAWSGSWRRRSSGSPAQAGSRLGSDLQRVAVHRAGDGGAVARRAARPSRERVARPYACAPAASSWVAPWAQAHLRGVRARHSSPRAWRTEPWPSG
jgi:hypothetical protein